jgi:Na+-transporting NADH:ubiquinone oxidoreductase subunit NqrC
VVLGSTVGLFFLILQLPINLYAGSILSDAALFVENKQNAVNTMSSAENEQQKLLSKEQLAKMSREEAKNYHAVKIDVQLVDDNSLVEDRDEGDEHIHRT